MMLIEISDEVMRLDKENRMATCDVAFIFVCLFEFLFHKYLYQGHSGSGKK